MKLDYAIYNPENATFIATNLGDNLDWCAKEIGNCSARNQVTVCTERVFHYQEKFDDLNHDRNGAIHKEKENQ